MDNLCHSLAGACLAKAGLDRRTPLATATLVLAANAPDIDGITYLTSPLPMYWRRGLTHGPIAMVVLPVLLTALMLAYDRLVRRRGPHAGRPAADPRGVLLLACIGTLSHPLLDFMNSYGIRLLMPFSGRWFYGDAFYIVDPWMLLTLGGGVALTALAARRGRPSPSAARAGLLAAGAYMALMLLSNLWARAEVQAGLDRAGTGTARFMVTPVFVNPLEREVLVDLGTRYEKGFLSFSPMPHFRPAGYGVEKNDTHPLVVAATQTETARRYLTWSRFPFWTIERVAPRVVVRLNDARYAGPGTRGWSGVAIELDPATLRELPPSAPATEPPTR